MNRIICFIFILCTVTGFSQTNKVTRTYTDTISARSTTKLIKMTDTVVVKTRLKLAATKFSSGKALKTDIHGNIDTFTVSSSVPSIIGLQDSLNHRVRYSDSTKKYVTPTQLSAAKQFKWVISGGGTNKIYTAVQAASAGDVVIVDAGIYTETNNIAKNGVVLYFMPNAIVNKTTSGYLFDCVTGGDFDFYVYGQGTFNTSHGCFYGFSGTASRTYVFEFNSITEIGANAIDIEYSYGQKYTRIKGRTVSSSAGYAIYIRYGNNIDIDVDYVYSSASTALLVQSYYYTVTPAAIIRVGAVVSSTSAFACILDGINIVANIGQINGINALQLLANSGGGVIGGSLVNSNVIGNIDVGNGSVSWTINGNINSGILTYEDRGSVIYSYTATQQCNLSFKWASVVVGNNVTLLLNSNFDVQSNVGAYTATPITINGANSTVDWYGIMNYMSFGGTNVINVNAGKLIIHGQVNIAQYSSGTATVLNSGGELLIKGIITTTQAYGTASSSIACLTLNGGITRFSGLIQNTLNVTGGNGISVIGNSSLIYEGGTIYCANSSANSINVATGKTLTAINKLNIFTNTATSGTIVNSISSGTPGQILTDSNVQ